MRKETRFNNRGNKISFLFFVKAKHTPENKNIINIKHCLAAAAAVVVASHSLTRMKILFVFDCEFFIGE